MSIAPGAIQAGQAYVEVTTDDRALGEGLRNASKQLKGWAKAMKGAGAAYALTFIADQANHFLDGVQKIQEGLAKGDMTFGDAVGETANELMKAIPIAGKFYEVGQRIRGMLDGSAAAQAKYNEELKRAAAQQKLQQEAHDQQLKLAKDTWSQAVKIGREVMLAATSSEPMKIRLQAEFDWADAQAQLAELRAKLAAWQKDPVLSKSNRGEITHLQSSIAALDAAVNARRTMAKVAEEKARTADLDAIVSDLLRRAAEAGQSDEQKLLEALRHAGATPFDTRFAMEQWQKIRTTENADREQQNADRLHDLKIAAIEDEHQRAIAAIDARYDVERRQAQRLGLDLAKIDQARQQELTNLEAQRNRELTRQRLESEQRLQDDIARLQVETTLKGRQKEIALLALEEKRVLEELAKVGGNVELVKQLFALRRQLVQEVKPALVETRTLGVRGTFNAVEAAGLAGGPAADRIAKATEDTARNTKRLVDDALGIQFR